MKLSIFAIYDNAVGAFQAPFFLHAKGQALRAFGDAVNDPNTPFYKHPGDYRLHFLGNFDDASGDFTLCDKPEPIAVGTDFKNPGEDSPPRPVKAAPPRIA